MNLTRTLARLSVSLVTALLVLILVPLFFESSLIFELSIGAGFVASIVFLLSYNFGKDLNLTRLLTGFLIGSTVYVFGTTVLMNIDRSRSFYVLVWSHNGNSEKEIVGLVTQQFGGAEIYGLRQRLSEQVSRGLLIEKRGEYSLTTLGNLTLCTSRILAKVFSLKAFQQIELETIKNES